MRASVRKVLDDLGNAIVALEPSDRRDVINIICALRGPDVDGDDGFAKASTTEIIRRLALPELCGVSTGISGSIGISGIPWDVAYSDATLDHLRAGYKSLNPPDVPLHFRDHIRFAIEALAREDQPATTGDKR